jgi:AcrR family transcriptional regulator
MANSPAPSDLRSTLIDAAIKMLAEEGPSAVQVRSIAKAAGVSTMAVYSTFGGMPDLLRAVADQGFRTLAAAFDETPKTGDPVTDIFRQALIYREVARQNPHLYDLMFGLSTRGSYRAIEHEPNSNQHSAAYLLAYDRLVNAAGLLVKAKRVRKDDPAVIAAQLWSFVHGFIILELTGHMTQFDDSVEKVLVPLGLNMVIGLGDEPKRAEKSILAAAGAMKPPEGRRPAPAQRRGRSSRPASVS